MGDYLDVTDPVALRRLLDLEGNITLRIHESAEERGFHLKSYVFLRGAEGVAFVGSSNLSAPALTTSIEWNYKVVASHDVPGFGQIRQGFESLLVSYATTAVTLAWIDAYERRRLVDRYWAPGVEDAGVSYEAPRNRNLTTSKKARL